MGPANEHAGAGPIRPRRLAFTIPLKSRASSTDWELAQANLRRTIRSIRVARGGDEALVTVACHEQPDLGELGAGVEILGVPFPVPSGDRVEGGRDKARKRRFAGAWLRERLEGEDVYVMFLDADDLVHRDLPAHVLEGGHQSYLVEQGYLFDASSGLLWRQRAGFHRICGSSFVCAFRADELPSSWEDESRPFAWFGASPDQRGHQEYDLVAEELGRPPMRLPLPGVVYVTNHAESRWTQRTGGRRQPAAVRDLVRTPAARRILSDEFAAPDLGREAATGSRLIRAAAVAGVTQATRGVTRRVRAGRIRGVIRTEAIGSDLDAGGLHEKVRSGLGWKLMTFLVGQGTQSVVAILLAHLLLPHDFGLAGMAIAFSGLAAVFSDLGLGLALIQRRTLTEEDRSTVFWINVGGGVALTLLGVALSPVVAAFFSNSRVMPLFAVLSCSFVLVALGQTQAALLTREMSFRSLELRTIAATLVGAAAAVSLAVAGFGPWAIIAQVLCTSGASTLMLWTVSPWRPRFAFSRASFRTLGSFGFKTLLIRLLLYVNLNGDNLLIGRYIGSVALGVYAIAYNVMLLPSSRITAPARDVLYAAFVRLQGEPRRMGEAWLRFNSLTASLLIPAFLGLVVTAPDFVPLVLGRRWDAAIPVLELLSVAGVAQSLQAFNGQVYQALGLPGLFLRFMLFSTGVTFSAFVIGLHWGVSGVAGSFAVARTIVLLANTVQISRLVELGLWRTLRSYLAILWRAGAMAGAVYAARLALHHAGLPLAPRLVVIGVGGALFYFALTAVAAPELVRDLRLGLRGRVPATT